MQEGRSCVWLCFPTGMKTEKLIEVWRDQVDSPGTHPHLEDPGHWWSPLQCPQEIIYCLDKLDQRGPEFKDTRYNRAQKWGNRPKIRIKLKSVDWMERSSQAYSELPVPERRLEDPPLGKQNSLGGKTCSYWHLEIPPEKKLDCHLISFQ